MKVQFSWIITAFLATSCLSGKAQEPLTPKSAEVAFSLSIEEGKSAPVVNLDANEVGSAKIDVVFVLDTTGSMSGLINAAKEKIWAIANTISKTKSKAKIRMGLVGYRDRGDEYVTVQTGLTDDIDAVYRDLMAYKADGGGDTPESVNQALHEAVEKMIWTEGDCVYRVIFLVGDAPPHMDYRDDVKYARSCELATAKKIFINAIQCGNAKETRPIWTEIAELSGGRFGVIPQSGGEVLPPSPYDKRLVELSVKLDETRLFYGSALDKQQQLSRVQAGQGIYDAASVQAVAQRAAYNSCEAGKGNFCGKQELVNDIAEGKVKLEDLEKSSLPDGMQELPLNELKELVAEKATQRKKLNAEITETTKIRQEWLAAELKKSGKEQPELDRVIFATVKEQAGKSGISFEEQGPSF